MEEPTTPSTEEPSHRWLERRSYKASAYSRYRVLAAKTDRSVSVVVPALDVAGTIGPIAGCLSGLRDAGVLDQVLVIDSGSSDNTLAAAEGADVEVHRGIDVMPELGAPLGKGDALWRGASLAKGDVVVFVDSDTQNFNEGFVLGLLGPLLETPELEMVKGAFVRDRGQGNHGGRVTELMARPLLRMLAPELVGLVQPLAGEVALRRSTLEELVFPAGYGVDVGLVIDVWARAGLEAIAQSDLGVRKDDPQELRDLGPMAYEVLAAVAARLLGTSDKVGPAVAAPGGDPEAIWAGRAPVIAERPPLRSLR